MTCLIDTTIAADESRAQHFLIGFKQQPGALGGRIKPPDEHIPHWRIQTFHEDAPSLTDEEVRMLGFQRVEVDPKDLK